MGGAVSKVFKTIAGPILTAGKSFVQGLFGRTKEAAKQVVHNTIDTVKQGAVDAIKTGDVRGSATAAWKKTKADALKRANAQLQMEKEKAKAAATEHIQGKQKELVQKANAAGVTIGAGFGAAHFKRMEKHAHSHINKVFADAKRHTKKAVAKRKTKKELNAHKKEVTRTLAATHKGGVLKLNAIAKDIRAKVAKVSTKKKGKGGGMKVGAGIGYAITNRDMTLKKTKKGSGGVRVPRSMIGKR